MAIVIVGDEQPNCELLHAKIQSLENLNLKIHFLYHIWNGNFYNYIESSNIISLSEEGCLIFSKNLNKLLILLLIDYREFESRFQKQIPKQSSDANYI